MSIQFNVVWLKKSLKEVLNDFRENYAKVRKLIDEDSKNDPEDNPYTSYYKAQETLMNMKLALEPLRNSKPEECVVPKMILDAMWGTILLNIGLINMETEEITQSEKVLMEGVCVLSVNSTKPEIVLILLNIYNNLGILWSHRDQPETAKVYLTMCKQVYEDFKCTMQMPLSIDHIVSFEQSKPFDDFILLETAHTLTLYYLAQVYGNLKQNLKSAIYCHITLKRQLQYNDYEAIDWALNSATLSQFFSEQNGFYQARHHLAAASSILDKYEAELRAVTTEDEAHLADIERFKHRAADVARCWAKYCLQLLASSKKRLMNDKGAPDVTDMSNLTVEDTENMFGGNLKNLRFSDLDLSKYEEKTGCKFLLTYEDARLVFLFCQDWLNSAKEYYTAETLASDYIQLVQDSSQCYAYLAFFEDDEDRRAKMHKRRVDILEAMLKQVNPTYYMQYCRQLWYELAEVYLDILNIKLDRLNKSNEKPTPQILKKINGLSEKSIEHFENFLNSVKTKDGVFPNKLETDLISPVVSALAYIGRNSMKRIALDKVTQIAHIERSLASYQSVVDICQKDAEAAAIMNTEYGLCESMCNVLPRKLKKLEGEIQAGAV